MIETVANERNIAVVGVDIGGATTDVFSVFESENEKGDIEKVFNRTVSANLGMSYSISNVFAEAGLDNVMRWMPIHMDEKKLRNIVKNKMIRPTTIPETLESLVFEQAIAREALRLAFEHHKSLAVGLKGVQQQRTISDAFEQTESGQSLVDMMELNMIIGSGGVLSHAPRRHQSAYMLIDAFLPEGVTTLTVDSIFMMPQLGVLAQVNKEAATQVFERDCLIYLGTCIAPVGRGRVGRPVMEIIVEHPLEKEAFIKRAKEESPHFPVVEDMTGHVIKKMMNYGEMYRIPLDLDETAKVTVKPVKGFDVGNGPGKEMTVTVSGGTTGIIFDTRGRRPFTIPAGDKERVHKLLEWAAVMEAYDVEALKKYISE